MNVLLFDPILAFDEAGLILLSQLERRSWQRPIDTEPASCLNTLVEQIGDENADRS